MSYLLEILGRGLLSELGAAFRTLLHDEDALSISQLETCVEQNPDDIESHRKLGIRLLADQQYGRAREMFQAALQLDSTDQVCHIGLACALDELGLTRTAAEQLRKVLQHHPENGPGWFVLGFCQEKLGDINDAIVSDESALDNTPQLRNAHERLAAVYLKLDNAGMAITHYEHLCWCDPGDLTAGLMLASLYLRAKRYEDAIRQYQCVITLEPDNWEAQDELVAACIEAEQYEEAVEVLTDRTPPRMCGPAPPARRSVHQARPTAPGPRRLFAGGVAEPRLFGSNDQGRHRSP